MWDTSLFYSVAACDKLRPIMEHKLNRLEMLSQLCSNLPFFLYSLGWGGARDRQRERERDRERERERERARERQTDRQTKRQTDSERQRETEREKERQRQRQTDSERKLDKNKSWRMYLIYPSSLLALLSNA